MVRELLLGSARKELMRSVIQAPLVVLAVVVAAAFSATTPGSQEKPKPRQEEKGGKVSSMTGCLDEQQGRYVLVDDRMLKRIADLQAESFPTEGFAKFVGHKVTVRGTISADGTVPLIKVRAIENVSDTCTPQQGQQ